MDISLVIITDGQKLEKLKKAIDSAKPLIREVVIVYQGSSESVSKQLDALSDFLFVTTRKGNADLDRNFAYTLASMPWILALDDDEYLSDEALKFIPRIVLGKADVVWFEFDNQIDGIDISDILGPDPHPRFFKNGGVMNWPMQAHQYPEIKSPRQVFTKAKIVHDRSYEEVIERHEKRVGSIDPRAADLERNFIGAVKKKLGKK